MSKILFLDIDGVVLPGRAYMLPNQTNNPYVTVFDQCAVSMVNKACLKQKRKIVLHSSWVKHWEQDHIFKHLTEQGISPHHLHHDWFTNPDLHWRYDRVDEWLNRHPEVTDYVILDDEPEVKRHEKPKIGKHAGHLLLTDFDEGITMKIYRQILDGVYPYVRQD